MRFLNQKEIGFYILRFGLAIVFLYFGISQVLDQSRWTALIPETGPDRLFGIYINEIAKAKLVLLNGVFDIIIAISLLTGFLIRLFSVLGFLHLLSITLFSLGFEPSGVRDIGLSFAILSLFFLTKKYEK